MKSFTANKITDYVKRKGEVSPHELINYLGITSQALFRHLKKLIQLGKLKKVGKPPRVFYLISDVKNIQPEVVLPVGLQKQAEDNFYLVTPAGLPMKGIDAFRYWCQKQGVDLDKTAEEYVAELNKYAIFKKDGFIDGMPKLKATFKQVYLDHLSYLDFYTMENFGRTKLGQMLLSAKQTQNRKQIFELIDAVKPLVYRLIQAHHINAVGFIPPTVKRQLQFMKELRYRLDLSQPVVPLLKVKTPVIVPQKTLSKLEDRVENAASTIIVNGKKGFNNILLIDDAMGSGATLNETARQIRVKGLCRGKLIGLVITGSIKGFDVLAEV